MSISTDTARPSRTGPMDKQQFISSLEQAWKAGSRWKGVTRPYTAGDVYRLRGSIDIEYSTARYGAARLWQLFQDDDYVAVLSAVTGNQAIQQAQAGLKAIYVSGWQVAADANNALEMYPDQSLYPSDSVPALLRRLNNALKRADEIAHMKGDHATYWFAPLVADAEAGFGRPLHAFEVMKNMIEAGSRGSDQVRRGDPRQIPGQDARVQLLAVVQLAQAPERSADRRLPEGAGGPELQVPVRDAVRVPRAEPQHVHVGAGLQGERDGRVRRAAESGVCLGEGRLRRGASPGVRGRRVLRRDHPDRDRRAVVGDRDGGLDGAAAVPGAVPGAPEGNSEALTEQMKRSTLYTLAAVFAIAALFFFMTTARAKVQCRVCMEYRGRTNCAAAVGPTEQAAREGAQTTACGPIASGMDEQIGCSRTPPTSVECKSR